MKNIELTEQEIATLLHAVGNEFNRSFVRRCTDGKENPGIAEERLLSIQDKLYKLLMED